MDILIVDDEVLARNELAYLLEQSEEVESIEEADSVESTLGILLQKQFDLVFLDIQLTGESGLTLADKINQMKNPPIIIFATAYDEYAIQAFERNARDYLLKPFESKRVHQAVHRAKATLKRKNSYEGGKIPDQQTIHIQTDERIFVEKIGHILALEVNQGETTIYSESQKYKVNEPLASWEKRLDGNFFMRVHRSYLVNLNKIKEIQPWFNQTYQLTLDGALKVPVSRTYMKEFRDRMNLSNE